MGKCCRFVKQVIKGCYCFGTVITFRINDNIEYKSLMGGILTIFFFISAIIYVTYMSYYFILRKNVDFIFSKKTINDQPFLNLTQIGYRFAFGVQFMDDDSSAVLNTSKYFNYSIREVQIFNSETHIETPIGIKLCDESDFRNEVNRTFKLRGLSKMYCPILNNINYTVEGTMMDPYYKYINLEIWLTDYSLKHFDELQNYVDIHPLEMSYYFLDNAIDYENRNNPLPNFLNYLFKGLDIGYEKDVEIIKSPMEFSNDENIIINNPQKIFGSTIDNHVDSFHAILEPNELGQTLVGKYIVKASPIMFSLTRSYQKLPSFVAELSGLLEEALIIILLIIHFFERQAIDNKLIKKMLKFQGCNNYNVKYLLHIFNNENSNDNHVLKIINKPKMKIKKKSLGVITQKNKKTLSIFDQAFPEEETRKKRNNFFSDNELNSGFKLKKDKLDNTGDNIDNNQINNSFINNDKKLSSSRNFIESISSINNPSSNKNIIESNKDYTYQNSKPTLIINKKKEENFAELGVIQAFWSKCCFWMNNKQERRRQFFDKAEKKIHYYFDVYNYIKKMQEVDLLVYSLFDDEQVKLIDFLSRPPLKITPREMDIYNEFANRQSFNIKIGKGQINELYKAYNTIKKKDDLNFEDLKLLRLVNAEIKFLS